MISPHSRDEWRKLSAQAQPQIQAIAKQLQGQNDVGFLANISLRTPYLIKSARQTRETQLPKWPHFTPRYGPFLLRGQGCSTLITDIDILGSC
jgi:hypothetical protein